MADLTAADVTVTLAPHNVEFVGMGLVMTLPNISFGGAGKTYPTNGVPLPSIGVLGMKKEIKRVFIQPPPGNGYVYKYDKTNHTIRIYQAANNILVKGGITADEAVGILASGPTLGKSAATDRTIAAADSATKGGVVPGPLAEVPAAHAPAATSIDLMVMGA